MALSRIAELQSNTDDTTGTLSHTTASFTPPSNCVLVATVGCVNGGGGADVRTGLALSGGGHSWTRQVGPLGGTVAGYTSAGEIWTAPVTTGASMTCTLVHAGNVGDDKSVALIHVLSYTSDTGTPEIGTPNTASGAHDQGDGAVQITLGSAPATASEVVAARWYSSNGSDTTATPEAAWTEIYDAQAGSGYGSLQTQIRTGSVSTAVDWDSVMDDATTAWNSCAMAVEVKESASTGVTDVNFTGANRGVMRGVARSVG